MRLAGLILYACVLALICVGIGVLARPAPPAPPGMLGTRTWGVLWGADSGVALCLPESVNMIASTDAATWQRTNIRCEVGK